MLIHIYLYIISANIADNIVGQVLIHNGQNQEWANLYKTQTIQEHPMKKRVQGIKSFTMAVDLHLHQERVDAALSIFLITSRSQPCKNSPPCLCSLNFQVLSSSDYVVVFLATDPLNDVLVTTDWSLDNLRIPGRLPCRLPFSAMLYHSRSPLHCADLDHSPFFRWCSTSCYWATRHRLPPCSPFSLSTLDSRWSLSLLLSYITILIWSRERNTCDFRDFRNFQIW